MHIDINTYQEAFLLYADGELSPEECGMVEAFAARYPHLQQELEMLRSVRLQPDETILFENKEALYKKEPDRIIPLMWWRWTAAAILLITVGAMIWVYLNSSNKPARNEIVHTQQKHFSKPDSSAALADEQTENPPIEITPPSDVKKSDATSIRSIATNADGKDEDGTKTTPGALSKEIFAKPKNVAEPAYKQDEAAVKDIEIANLEHKKDPIDIAVIAQTMDPEPVIEDKEIMAINAVHRTSEEIDQSSDDDIIYFANTTVSKRNKLRGIFRKATRIIDKVNPL